MKYSLVQITVCGKKWVVTFEDCKGDRKNEKTVPNPLGFYYYKSSLGKRQAFKELRKAMLTAHYNKINELTKSAAKLKKLKMPSE